ncbi:hypothetical protein I2I11_11425 [Pontibacter sp. 172403-2]|uniref:hypothetical protein n=1 Tax=Pontibacter rufus TaxID=2791028 RepID=UPI0018AFD849|nr:hypothetical protein [Pontibacter sp. 172403-2]MBF9253904.1 hypothetical protein [Pontibacter sp. 172403-2]
MSARSFELLIEAAYHPEQPHLFEGGPASVYEQLEKAFKASRLKGDKPTEELGYRFEMVRLGMAIAFVKAFTRLSGNEKSREALEVLQEALKAKSTREIDKIIQKKIESFDHLYHEIFVNEQREQILALFEQTLDAGTKEELDELILEGLEVLQQVDWEAAAQDEDDDELPHLDEDFLKNL